MATVKIPFSDIHAAATNFIRHRNRSLFFEKLILTSTNDGDIVLDPFMGSGTTAVGALNTGRDFIGCDISQQYVDIATNRIMSIQHDV